MAFISHPTHAVVGAAANERSIRYLASNISEKMSGGFADRTSRDALIPHRGLQSDASGTESGTESGNAYL